MSSAATDTKDSFEREGIAPSGLRSGALAHAAHTLFPGLGTVLCSGIARSRSGHPLSVSFECADAFVARWNAPGS
jgi:hypothetical protein